MQDFDFSFNPKACEGCGAKCCVGESGYIFVTIQEMQKISAFLKLELEEF
ncbi:YkgJ family cysteine cluster protein, partial [Helicobacter pylori]|nr:YkgJ family cysteine cluster protein [Helicobacter pylori]